MTIWENVFTVIAGFQNKELTWFIAAIIAGVKQVIEGIKRRGGNQGESATGGKSRIALHSVNYRALTITSREAKPLEEVKKMIEAPDLIIVSECDDEKNPKLKGKFFADVPGMGKTKAMDTAKSAYNKAVAIVRDHRHAQGAPMAELEAKLAALEKERLALQDQIKAAREAPRQILPAFAVLEDPKGYAWGVGILDEDTGIEDSFGVRVRSVYFRKNLNIRPISPGTHIWWWGFGRHFD